MPASRLVSALTVSVLHRGDEFARLSLPYPFSFLASNASRRAQVYALYIIVRLCCLGHAGKGQYTSYPSTTKLLLIYLEIFVLNEFIEIRLYKNYVFNRDIFFIHVKFYFVYSK